MREKIRKLLCLCITALMVCTAMGVTPAHEKVYAANTGNGKVIFTGIGKYSGTIELTFPIEPKPITSKDLIINLPVIEFAYTGNEIQPDVEIEGLTRDKDFQLTYSNNINEGLGKITIKGIGNYKGSLSKNFLIVKKSSGNGNGNTKKHIMTYHAAVAAKCETAGNVAYYTCEECKGYRRE